MKPCLEYFDQISAFADGELTAEESELVQAHLNECEDCNALFALLTEGADAVSESLEEPPAELYGRVMADIANSTLYKNKKPRKAAMVLRWAVPVAACLVIAFIVARPGGLNLRQFTDYGANETSAPSNVAGVTQQSGIDGEQAVRFHDAAAAFDDGDIFARGEDSEDEAFTEFSMDEYFVPYGGDSEDCGMISGNVPAPYSPGGNWSAPSVSGPNNLHPDRRPETHPGQQPVPEYETEENAAPPRGNVQEDQEEDIIELLGGDPQSPPDVSVGGAPCIILPEIPEWVDLNGFYAFVVGYGELPEFLADAVPVREIDGVQYFIVPRDAINYFARLRPGNHQYDSRLHSILYFNLELDEILIRWRV